VRDAIAIALWSLLGCSALLTIYGIDKRSSAAMFAAAMLSFIFSIASIFSIGIFIVGISVSQFIAGLALRRQHARRNGERQ
jgi:hypothetical protein